MTHIVYREKGQLHREDGPAVIYDDGNRQWWQYDKLHRIDGPAITYASGLTEWYIHGVSLPFDVWVECSIITLSDEEKLMLKLKYA